MAEEEAVLVHLHPEAVLVHLLPEAGLSRQQQPPHEEEVREELEVQDCTMYSILFFKLKCFTCLIPFFVVLRDTRRKRNWSWKEPSETTACS